MRRIKPKKCAVCGKQFTPYQSLQKWCSVDCGVKLAKRRKFDKRTRELKQQTAQQNRAHWTAKAQSAVNEYVRLRDGQKCLSCGITTGQFHAGHYRAIGKQNYHLRFNLLNINAQCAQCNSGGMKSGNIVEYRKGLVRKIGEERVLALEHDNSTRRYSIEYLRRLAGIFRRRAKYYRSRRDNCIG